MLRNWFVWVIDAVTVLFLLVLVCGGLHNWLSVVAGEEGLSIQ